ncbi:diguanylate cyclase (GGDEF) domain-containing protein [Klenkia marina]|uniref:Diguanylate cyclase (GGDEF) domain-containing protein n=1 Tax=Klenkia marina TaxID=1960309 RepID=A0A1G4XHS2_9ACTN|nr:bifunctional diguanylate cyclase/phosphodiesterase [Klenkia marina]SCX40783.1 diguanylate cyclase (GGDEF) domain-containing protein [Klenkia marina]
MSRLPRHDPVLAALGAAAGVLAAWFVLAVGTTGAGTWRVVVDVLVLAVVHGVAVVVTLTRRRPDLPGGRTRVVLAGGLVALGVAAVGARLLPVGGPSTLGWLLPAGHLLGQLCLAAVLVWLVRRVHGRLLGSALALDAASAALAIAAVAGTVVWIGLDERQPVATVVAVLLLTACDVALVAGSAALFSALRPGRTGGVALLLVGTVLVLAADLVNGYTLHRDGRIATPPAAALSAAACLALAWATDRSVRTRDRLLTTADRLDARSHLIPFSSGGAILLAVYVADTRLDVQQWLVPALLGGCGSLALVGIRFHLVLQVARDALAQLADARTDPLTGLLNRRGLGAALDRWSAAGDPVTLLALDLDGFRRVNEEAGHETGDEVLRRVATRLARLAGPGTVAARIDGDDFALAFPGTDPTRADLLASEARAQLGRPFDVGQHRLHLTVNVGTAVSHGVADEPGMTDGLLRCADQALAQAQASTSGRAVHDPARCGRTQDAGLLTGVADLHAALAAEDQLLLHFQPQHRIVGHGTGSTATVVGCEALLRWAHPTRGLLGPAEVLRAAEHGHLSAAVAERVLDLALGAVASWWDSREVPVAVNLSPVDLDDELLPHRITGALDRHGLPARALTVEVVEDTLMLDPDRALQTLTALRSIGVRIAVDDYGTGYSSLAYLHRLPIDEVKFDRSLTAGISKDAAAAVIVGHSIRLAHDLGLSALAEGIEEPADLELLARLGCDAVQGWLTGYPLPVQGWVTTLDLGAATR